MGADADRRRLTWTAGVDWRRLKRGQADGRWRVDGWRGRRTLAHWLAWLARTADAGALAGMAGADGGQGKAGADGRVD